VDIYNCLYNNNLSLNHKKENQLLIPVKIGSTELRNRIVMALELRYEEERKLKIFYGKQLVQSLLELLAIFEETY